MGDEGGSGMHAEAGLGSEACCLWAFQESRVGPPSFPQRALSLILCLWPFRKSM